MNIRNAALIKYALEGETANVKCFEEPSRQKCADASTVRLA